MISLLVRPDGHVQCVYGEEIDLAAIGVVRIARASHVEPDAQGRWWADLTPVSGPVLGPFGRRSDALAAEHTWLEGHLLHRLQAPNSFLRRVARRALATIPGQLGEDVPDPLRNRRMFAGDIPFEGIPDRAQRNRKVLGMEFLQGKG